MTASPSRSAAIRAKLPHPVIDADGHLVELTPVYLEYIAKVGGADMARRYQESPLVKGSYHQQVLRTTLAQRRDSWTTMTSWWFNPTKNAVDRATSHLPALLNQRMDDLGLDFTVLYPSEGLYALSIPDDGLRQAVARAYNTYVADLFCGFGARMTPTAVIPVHTPQEAIAELRYAVQTLGLKTVVMPCHVARPVPKHVREHPGAAPLLTRWDVLALDSEYDYDPLWQACVDLKIAPGFHGGSQGVGFRRSVSNFSYNHIGNAAASNESMAKALVLGGVTRRFPTFQCSFLEGGINWACGLYADLIGHWEKRNAAALEALDPRNLDAAAVLRLFRHHGAASSPAQEQAIRAYLTRDMPRPDTYDDYALCGISQPSDFHDLFVRPFFFGCEADDPMNAHAADSRANPHGATLQIVLGSDIGHWDVPDMTQVLEEAYEAVEHGAMTPDAFRDFVFANPVRLFAGANPRFFDGSIVESHARRLLAPAG